MEMDVLQREHYLGLDDHSERLETLTSQASAIEQQATDLQQAWEQQKSLYLKLLRYEQHYLIMLPKRLMTMSQMMLQIMKW